MNFQNEKVDEEVIQKIEIFIQHMRDLDYDISDKGKSLIYEYTKEDGQRGEECLTDLLAKSITEYKISKNLPLKKIESIYKCEHWINIAFANGVVKEGSGLINKFKECYEKNIELRKELEVISNDLLNAHQRIEELEQIMPSAGSEHA